MIAFRNARRTLNGRLSHLQTCDIKGKRRTARSSLVSVRASHGDNESPIVRIMDRDRRIRAKESSGNNIIMF